MSPLPVFRVVDQIVQTVQFLLAFMDLIQQFYPVGREETGLLQHSPFCPQFKVSLNVRLAAPGVFQVAEQELFFRQSVYRKPPFYSIALRKNSSILSNGITSILS